ncbi:MAG: prephenate dehydratase [Alphaproteobacteria bacterium]|nr:prephenate dehydratase [Alphaproteobacteria bacterium]MCA0449884.1 prephenate dehydratase [Pseudomonadota bacterium]
MRSAKIPARIAFQGVPGAYSHLACKHAYPKLEPLPCASFEDAFDAVRGGKAILAMIPIENSTAGRVAEIHQMIPEAGLHIIGEHFERVNHHLLAPPGATLKTLKTVQSHVQALDQCRGNSRALGLKRVTGADTAGSAAEIAKAGDITRGAIASSLAGEIYGLKSLKKDFEDAAHNTTRFVVLSKKPKLADVKSGPCVTTFVFRVKNRAAALYKAMGGFATNGVNMTKLESYMMGGKFTATQFYADVEGHPDQLPLAHALEELEFFSDMVKILGVYPAHRYRLQGRH